VGGYDDENDEAPTIDIKHEIVEDTASQPIVFEISEAPEPTLKKARPVDEPADFPE
jgi:hypothetical protein